MPTEIDGTGVQGSAATAGPAGSDRSLRSTGLLGRSVSAVADGRLLDPRGVRPGIGVRDCGRPGRVRRAPRRRWTGGAAGRGRGWRRTGRRRRRPVGRCGPGLVEGHRGGLGHRRAPRAGDGRTVPTGGVRNSTRCTAGSAGEANRAINGAPWTASGAWASRGPRVGASTGRAAGAAPVDDGPRSPIGGLGGPSPAGLSARATTGSEPTVEDPGDDTVLVPGRGTTRRAARTAPGPTPQRRAPAALTGRRRGVRRESLNRRAGDRPIITAGAVAGPSAGPAGSSSAPARLVIAAANPLSGADSAAASGTRLTTGASGAADLAGTAAAAAGAAGTATTGSSSSTIGGGTPVGPGLAGTAASERCAVSGASARSRSGDRARYGRSGRRNRRIDLIAGQRR